MEKSINCFEQCRYFDIKKILIHVCFYHFHSVQLKIASSQISILLPIA